MIAVRSCDYLTQSEHRPLNFNDIWTKPEAREFVKSIYQYLDEEGNVDPAQRAKFQELIAEEDKKIEVSYF